MGSTRNNWKKQWRRDENDGGSGIGVFWVETDRNGEEEMVMKMVYSDEVRKVV